MAIGNIVRAALVAALISGTARAADLPASHCEIFIRNIGSSPSSHGSGTITAIVKVGWIGNDEYIERVGLYAQQQVLPIGDGSQCPWHPDVPSGWRVIDPVESYHEPIAFGEYLFSLPILTGTVLSSCGGFHYSTQGTFFVQTNKNTYWLNPGMDPGQLFYFDRNGYDVLGRQLGYGLRGNTDRSDLAYYNPLTCR